MISPRWSAPLPALPRMNSRAASFGTVPPLRQASDDALRLFPKALRQLCIARQSAWLGAIAIGEVLPRDAFKLGPRRYVALRGRAFWHRFECYRPQHVHGGPRYGGHAALEAGSNDARVKRVGGFTRAGQA